MMNQFLFENWKAIPGFEGRYEVSDLGRVKSLIRCKPLILKPCLINSGYLVVNLRDREKRAVRTVHRLVASVFVPGASDELQVNHINGRKVDNRAGNLDWVTPKENYQHAISTGLFSPGRPIIGTPVTGGEERRFDSAAAAAFALTGDARQGTNITHCLRGRYKSSCEHRWMYADA